MPLPLPFICSFRNCRESIRCKIEGKKKDALAHVCYNHKALICFASSPSDRFNCCSFEGQHSKLRCKDIFPNLSTAVSLVKPPDRAARKAIPLSTVIYRTYLSFIHNNARCFNCHFCSIMLKIYLYRSSYWYHSNLNRTLARCIRGLFSPFLTVHSRPYRHVTTRELRPLQ